MLKVTPHPFFKKANVMNTREGVINQNLIITVKFHFCGEYNRGPPLMLLGFYGNLVSKSLISTIA